MTEHRFPPAAIHEVLHREVGFGVFKRLTILPMMTVSRVVMTLILWLRAGVAHWTNSPLVGLITLIVLSAVFVLLVTRVRSRRAVPSR